MGWQWHQLDHTQIICTSLQTDNHVSTSPLRFLQARCPSCHPIKSIKALKTLTTHIILNTDMENLSHKNLSIQKWSQNANTNTDMSNYPHVLVWVTGRTWEHPVNKTEWHHLCLKGCFTGWLAQLSVFLHLFSKFLNFTQIISGKILTKTATKKVNKSPLMCRSRSTTGEDMAIAGWRLSTNIAGRKQLLLFVSDDNGKLKYAQVTITQIYAHIL